MSTRRRKIRTAIVLTFFLLFVIVAGPHAINSAWCYFWSLGFHEISSGVYLRIRDDRSWAAIRFGSPMSHGYSIYPEGQLRHYEDTWLSGCATHDDISILLTERDSVWMHNICRAHQAHRLTNPRLRDFEKLLLEAIDAIDSSEEENNDCDRLTSIAAASYVFFGYAVRNEADLKLLKQERYERTEENVKEDIVTEDGHILRVVHKGVELEIMTTDSDETAEEIRSSIPVMVENPNVDLGHPLDEILVVYLDGRVESIPFGEKFPATQALIDFLKPE